MIKNTRVYRGDAAGESRIPLPTDHIDTDSPVTRSGDIYEDARGVTYHSVRFCDLTRICDK